MPLPTAGFMNTSEVYWGNEPKDCISHTAVVLTSEQNVSSELLKDVCVMTLHGAAHHTQLCDPAKGRGHSLLCHCASGTRMTYRKGAEPAGPLLSLGALCAGLNSDLSNSHHPEP